MATRTACGLSTHRDPRVAATEAATLAAEGLGGPADLVLAFTSGAHLAQPDALLEPIHDVLAPDALAGCGAAGVLGDGHEVEHGSGVSVWAASFGGGHAEAFHASLLHTELGTALAGMPDPEGAAGLLLFPDPYSVPTDALLSALDGACPGAVVLGGLPSARTLEGEAALLHDGEVAGAGVVGVVLRDVAVDACISQGAIPIGPELTVTAAEGHVIHELAGQPALERIRTAILGLEESDRDLLLDGLLLGIVVNTAHADYTPGDFLVRGVLGADPVGGSITVGSPVRTGQIVRLHARDADTAGRDLERTLRVAAGNEEAPAGALVFSCQTRSSGLFGDPGHDARAVSRAFGGAPTAGFQAAGEIGPIAGRSFLHGFTATVAVFRP